MKSILDQEQFYALTIARSDNDDPYSLSGYAVLSDGKRAAIVSIGHCSCYGTWEGLDNGPIELDITVGQLIRWAKRKADPNFPTRMVNSADYDANHLLECYEQVLAWAKSNNKG